MIETMYEEKYGKYVEDLRGEFEKNKNVAEALRGELSYDVLNELVKLVLIEDLGFLEECHDNDELAKAYAAVIDYYKIPSFE